MQEHITYSVSQHMQKTLVRAQSHSKHQRKSLTPEETREYQQPKSHSLPHTAFLCINRERVEEGETRRGDEAEDEEGKKGESEIEVGV